MTTSVHDVVGWLDPACLLHVTRLLDPEALPCFRAASTGFREAARSRAGEAVEPERMVRCGASVASWAWAQPGFREAAGRQSTLACAELGNIEVLNLVLDRYRYTGYDSELWASAGNARQHYDDSEDESAAAATRRVVAAAATAARRVATAAAEDEGEEFMHHLASAIYNDATLTAILELIKAEAIALVAMADSKPGQFRTLNLAIARNSTLTYLTLCDCDIKTDGAQHIANALMTNTNDIRVNDIKVTIERLDLSRNRFGDDGALHLARAIVQNSTLTYLTLCDCDIKTNGAQHIANALMTNTSALFKHIATITYLNLGECAIGPISVGHLASAIAKNSSLITLNLDNDYKKHFTSKFRNGIGDVGAGHLATAISVNVTLARISIHDSDIGKVGMQHLNAVGRAESRH
ncbi:hypothetical protein T492DRAFT_899307 [Pavlovales sp. CCMP2436]|nr:hypothetical protein T492DRAFT_899307 [Pavlovales sp. CCMP2436]